MELPPGPYRLALLRQFLSKVISIHRSSLEIAITQLHPKTTVMPADHHQMS